MSLTRRLIRTVFTFLHRFRSTLLRGTGRGRAGVHAVPVTRDGKVVLVRLTYAPGWRVPGGGLKRGEGQEQGLLRELREEIGLISHGAVERLPERRADSGEAALPSAFFVVRDVVYRPRRSLEVEAVREFDPARLPDDTTCWTAHLVGLCGLAKPPASPTAAG
jgi:ADP-ribose pyrophosphatase YjhB (NUDIX family)